MSDQPPSLASVRFEQLLDDLAAKSPAPGGGAAAGMVGATAAALGGMVVAYSLGRKSLSDHQATLEQASDRLARARAIFLLLADEDAQAYAHLNTLMKLPEDHPDRVAHWDEAMQGALTPPRSTLAAACELLRLLGSLVGKTNPYLDSDLGVSAVLAESAARSAAWNIAVNTPSLPDDLRADIQSECDRLAADARSRADEIERACRSRLS